MRNGKTNPLLSMPANGRIRSLAVATAFSLTLASPGGLLASPGLDDTGATVALAQNVDYIGPEAGAGLDLDFPVMVPSWVPGPFGGSPAIDSGNGYYSLYWMNAGGEPTFLQVTGQVGGALPAGSPYDLNVQLFINASVGGNGAIHDVTPAYDTVWWIAGGVLYKVESRNSGADSLTIANSLIAFVPPVTAEPEPEPTEPEPTEPPAEAEPEEPAQEPDPIVSEPETDVDEPESEPDADEPTTAPTVEADTAGSEANAGDADPTAAAAEANGDAAGDPESAAGTGGTDEPQDGPPPTSDGTGETTYSSDGTGGAQNLVIVGDGTGGTIEVIIPRGRDNQQTP